MIENVMHVNVINISGGCGTGIVPLNKKKKKSLT